MLKGACVLLQADFPDILNELKTDPNALGKHLNDQRVQVPTAVYVGDGCRCS